MSERLFRRGRLRIGQLAAGSVLEVAIGSGHSLPWYGAQVSAITGIDLSRGMLRVCRARAPQRTAIPVRLVEADAVALPFPDQAFDSIVYSLCLCTIPDPAAAVREGLRVARPGAAMLFVEHVRSHLEPVALLQDLAAPLLTALASDHIDRRTEAVVRQAGVEVGEVARWGAGIFTLIAGRAPR